MVGEDEARRSRLWEKWSICIAIAQLQHRTGGPGLDDGGRKLQAKDMLPTRRCGVGKRYEGVGLALAVKREFRRRVCDAVMKRG